MHHTVICGDISRTIEGARPLLDLKTVKDGKPHSLFLLQSEDTTEIWEIEDESPEQIRDLLNFFADFEYIVTTWAIARIVLNPDQEGDIS